MRRFILISAMLSSSCFFLVNNIAPVQCEEGAAARCDGNELVTCESGIEHRDPCGAFACDATLARCGACGDGFVDTAVGEICDDGNNDNGDGCRDDCTEELCGDNIQDPQEQCDDGNTFSGDGCVQDCSKREICGDSVIDDILGDVSIPAANVVSITFEYLVTSCNNTAGSLTFLINDASITTPPANTLCDCLPGIESFTETSAVVLGALQDGPNTFRVEADDADSIILSWVLVNISDGANSVDIILQDLSNGVGGGAANREPDLCVGGTIGGQFSFEKLVNGVVDLSREGCDDGNFSDGDGCSAQCIREFCGDGIVNNGEICDDGNQVDTDGCSNACF